MKRSGWKRIVGALLVALLGTASICASAQERRTLRIRRDRELWDEAVRVANIKVD